MPTRRLALKALGTLGVVSGAGLGFPAWAHNSAGLVSPPQAPPPVRLLLHDGRQTTLRELLTGRVTAVQLMFVGCTATCPIQGALFASAEQLLGHRTGKPPLMQLVSLSIDPLNDDAKALKGWRQRFGAGESWVAGSPVMKDVDPWLDFLQGRNKGVDRHTAQVYFFNPRAELAFRTVDFPPAPEIVKLLKALSVQPT